MYIFVDIVKDTAVLMMFLHDLFLHCKYVKYYISIFGIELTYSKY